MKTIVNDLLELFFDLDNKLQIVPAKQMPSAGKNGARHPHRLSNCIDDKRISTVFLNMPHGINDDEFFESAIISGDDIEVVDRYTSFIEAFVGHQRIYFNLIKK